MVGARLQVSCLSYLSPFLPFLSLFDFLFNLPCPVRATRFLLKKKKKRKKKTILTKKRVFMVRNSSIATFQESLELCGKLKASVY
jgi:hypothetical protein